MSEWDLWFGWGSRTGLLAIHGDAKHLSDPRMRAICTNNKLCMQNFGIFVGFSAQPPQYDLNMRVEVSSYPIPRTVR
jgi:hypothetical protein